VICPQLSRSFNRIKHRKKNKKTTKPCIKDSDIGECTFKRKYVLRNYEINRLTTMGVKRKTLHRIEYKCWGVHRGDTGLEASIRSQKT